jgi:diguanylate cyclase (GGDEF)-like protein
LPAWLDRSIARRVALLAAIIVAAVAGSVGLLVVGVVLRGAPAGERDAVLWVAVAGGACTVGASAIGTWFIVDRMLSRRLRMLTEVVQAATRGRYLAGARSTAPDELGTLSRAFDTLVGQITDLSVQQIESGRELAWTRHELKLKETVALLFELTQTLGTETELDAILRAMCARVAPALGVAEMAILLYDERTGELVTRATAGFPAEEDPIGVSFSTREGAVGSAITSKRPVYIPDTRNDPRYLYFKGRHPMDGSFACLPMTLGARAVGVMTALRPGVDQFGETDRRLLESLAGTAGLAIAHAQVTARLSELAMTDELTQVANRRLLMDRLGRELDRSQRSQRPLAVLMADLDHFKRVNDVYGHLRGDEALRLVSRELGAHLRRMDTVGRYGGEEFVVLLPETGRAQALVVAEKLREAVKALRFPDDMTLTISIGVAVVPEDGHDAEALIDAADRALLQAKRDGRDRVVAHSPAPSAAQAK